MKAEMKEKSDSMKKLFFNSKGVQVSKNHVLKIRCEVAVESTGLSKTKFYYETGLTKQKWYFYSWGLEKFPHDLKIKLCDMYGKPFRDLFLGEVE